MQQSSSRVLRFRKRREWFFSKLIALTMLTLAAFPAVAPSSVISSDHRAITGIGNVTGRFGPTAVEADLAVNKTDLPDPAARGAGLTYEVTARNNGPADATGVTLIDILPADVTFVSATPDQGSCSASAGTVTCHLGSLPVNTVATVTIAVTVSNSAPETLANTASVTGDQDDPSAVNNIASELTSVAIPTPIPVGGHLAVIDRGAVLWAILGPLGISLAALAMLLGVAGFIFARHAKTEPDI